MTVRVKALAVRGVNRKEVSNMASVNVMNPEGIETGDMVCLRDPRKGEPKCQMLVLSVGGSYGNKVFCEKIGHELYAQCFRLVAKAAK